MARTLAADVVGQRTSTVQPTDSLEDMLAIYSASSAQPSAKVAASEFVAAMPSDVRIGLQMFAEVTVLASPRPIRGVASTTSIRSSSTATPPWTMSSSGSQFYATVEHKVLVILSDGKDEGSSATLDEAIAASQGISIETISLTTVVNRSRQPHRDVRLI